MLSAQPDQRKKDNFESTGHDIKEIASSDPDDVGSAEGEGSKANNDSPPNSRIGQLVYNGKANDYFKTAGDPKSDNLNERRKAESLSAKMFL